MMNDGLSWRLWAVVCLAVLLVGAIGQKNQNALKVEKLLKKIEQHHSGDGSPDRKAEVTERELNDYIGYRLARERQTAINSLNVYLLDNDHVRGRIVFDARQLNLGLIFGESLDFDFEGRLHSRRGGARIDLGKLLLHGRPVSPQALDMVLGAIALSNGTQPSHIDDWYKLPRGLKRVAVKKGRADLYY